MIVTAPSAPFGVVNDQLTVSGYSSACIQVKGELS